MTSDILIKIVLVLGFVFLIANIIIFILKLTDTKKSTCDARVINKRFEKIDGKKIFFATFELIDGRVLELMVPKSFYKEIWAKAAGRLTFESMKFINFSAIFSESEKGLYAKNY